jgi:glycosyltransferase involved in cell wall biosynthesis
MVSPQIRRVTLPIDPVGWKQSVIRSGYSFEADEIYSRWGPNLQTWLQEELCSNSPDLVILTMPPFSLAPMAKWLTARQVPLIVDLRDAWSDWLFAPYASYLHYLNILFQERSLLRNNHLLTTTSPVTLERLKELHPSLKLSHSTVVYNSYEAHQLRAFQAGQPGQQRTTISYAGVFYYNPYTQGLLERPWYKKRPHQWLQYVPRLENWLYRSPYFFFKILEELSKIEPQTIEKLEITFAGSRPNWWESMLPGGDLGRRIQHVGRLSKEKVLELQLESDLNLLTSCKIDGADDYSIAGKSFEYIASGRPTLGVVARGAQRELLQRCGNSLLLDPDQPRQAAETLSAYLKGEITLQPNSQFISSLETRATMTPIYEFIDQLTPRRP